MIKLSASVIALAAALSKELAAGEIVDLLVRDTAKVLAGLR